MYISYKYVSQWYNDYLAKKLVPAADTSPPPIEIDHAAAATQHFRRRPRLVVDLVLNFVFFMKKILRWHFKFRFTAVAN